MNNHPKEQAMTLTKHSFATTMQRLVLGVVLAAGTMAAGCDDTNNPSNTSNTGTGGNVQNRCTNGSTGFGGANGNRGGTTGNGTTGAGGRTDAGWAHRPPPVVALDLLRQSARGRRRRDLGRDGRRPRGARAAGDEGARHRHAPARLRIQLPRDAVDVGGDRGPRRV